MQIICSTRCTVHMYFPEHNVWEEKYSAVHSRTVELPEVDKSIIMEATKYILHWSLHWMNVLWSIREIKTSSFHARAGVNEG